MEYMK